MFGQTGHGEGKLIREHGDEEGIFWTMMMMDEDEMAQYAITSNHVYFICFLFEYIICF